MVCFACLLLAVLYQVQLKPENFEAAAAAAGFPVTLRMQDGYDHSYFFISTFMDDHLEHHAKHLLRT
jgi:S-formylglutathione hydrolase